MVMNVHLVAVFPLEIPVRLVGVLKRRMIVLMRVDCGEVLNSSSVPAFDVMGYVNMLVTVGQLVMLVVYEFDHHSFSFLLTRSYKPSPVACGSSPRRT